MNARQKSRQAAVVAALRPALDDGRGASELARQMTDPPVVLDPSGDTGPELLRGIRIQPGLGDDMLTARAVAALTDLVRELRPDWHRPGIRAAIHGGDFGDHTALDIAAALIHRTADPANRTPQLQPADFRPPPAARCPVTASGCWPHGLCAGCQVAAGALVEPAPAWSEQPMSDTAWRSLLAVTAKDRTGTAS